MHQITCINQVFKNRQLDIQKKSFDFSNTFVSFRDNVSFHCTIKTRID
jgi:hypothetical protein